MSFKFVKMALFWKFFYRKPPDGLLEIYDRVYGLSSLCVFSSTLIHSLFGFWNFVQFRFSTLRFSSLESETKMLVFHFFLYLEWNRNWVSLFKLFIHWVSLSKLPLSMMPAKLQDIIETLFIESITRILVTNYTIVIIFLKVQLVT